MTAPATVSIKLHMRNGTTRSFEVAVAHRSVTTRVLRVGDKYLTYSGMKIDKNQAVVSYTETEAIYEFHTLPEEGDVLL